MFSPVLALDDLIELSRSILAKEKLNGRNFLDRYRNLRIVLKNEQKLHHLEEALIKAPPTTTTAAIRNAYTRRVTEQQEVACLMLEEGQSISTYVLKMKAYLDQMDRLGYLMPLVLGVNLILTSLSKDHDQFVKKYNMHDMGKTIRELHAMLKLAKKSIPKKAHAVLVIRKGVISLSRLWDKCFRHKFMDNGAILLSKDNLFYFNAFPHDGIFEIDMHIFNESSIYTCSNKKTKHNFDSTFLWHCRLGHINKKLIVKLQHDGFLKSIDDESFDVCVSCIYGKMERNPFTFASERADYLLGIIHSDLCGLFRTTSREGNQLRKIIKALRSDRGGEYLSQEFLDHLRSHGVNSQVTPPYMPKHNGLSERRNQTLLDMVQSMMSLTTLPMSFKGYALESIACILNMIPTTKVNKTPYEMWHEKVSNLSYLKAKGEGFCWGMMVEGSGRRGLIEMDEGVAGKGIQGMARKLVTGEQWFKTWGDKGKGLSSWQI
nr:zinc finger, CCHC-type [Tanacetum cinerariifolium]